MIDDDKVLQMLVTGMIYGSLIKTNDFVSLDISNPELDDDGNYKPEINITGKNSGTKLKVKVEIVERDEE